MRGFRVRREASVNATLCFVVRFNEDINKRLSGRPLATHAVVSILGVLRTTSKGNRVRQPRVLQIYAPWTHP